MFALVDCNNFFVSCERVFQPGLNHVPVCILSNNDGCIIARSEEVRAMGIPMGAPYFQWADVLKRNQVRVFSSNYELYGDMSARVMSILAQQAGPIEICSIDEAFVDISQLKSEASLHGWASELHTTIRRWTGLPTSVGVAPTKTLAKLAGSLAKKRGGSAVLTTPEAIAEALVSLPVEAIWGVGHRLKTSLNGYRIFTALELAQAEPYWIQQRYGVTLLRTVRELNGISCLDVETTPEAPHTVISSRSFGRPVTELHELKQAVATYTARGAERMRAKGCTASLISVHIRTSKHSIETGHFFSKDTTVSLPGPTADTRKLIAAAHHGLEAIYKCGPRYAKALIMLSGLQPDTARQTTLFAPTDSERDIRLMGLLDSLNATYGRGAVQLAAEGLNRQWAMRRNLRTPSYTTNWHQLYPIAG